MKLYRERIISSLELPTLVLVEVRIHLEARAGASRTFIHTKLYMS